MKTLLLILLFSPPLLDAQTTMKKQIQLGDSSIILNQKYVNTSSPILYLNIHEDEFTSIKAIDEFVKKQPLNFIVLNHHKTRRIAFNIKTKTFSIDPNRIYTHKGRKATLEPRQLFRKKALVITESLANEIINAIKQYNIIVTMHNNTDVNYSIKSYLPGEDESQNTADVYVSNKWDADDFIYTTEKVYFEYLKAKDVNVILQDNSNYVNDGSLSVYCGEEQIKYINIEAQKGHLTEQIKLVKIIDEMLSAFN